MNTNPFTSMVYDLDALRALGIVLFLGITCLTADRWLP